MSPPSTLCVRTDGSGQTVLLDGDVGVGAPVWIAPPPAPGQAKGWPQVRRRFESRGYDSCELVDSDAGGGDLSLYACRREGDDRAVEVYVEAPAAVRRSTSTLETDRDGCLLYDRGQTWLAVTRYDERQMSRALWDALELGTHVQTCPGVVRWRSRSTGPW
jgi:hypothetical protein